MREQVYERTPAMEVMDKEEGATGIDELRETRKKAVELLNAFAAEIDSALNDPDTTIGRIATAFYGPSFAMGLLAIGGASMGEIAERFGITRAAISKKAVVCSMAHDLGASFAMKSPESRVNYRRSRENVVKKQQRNDDDDEPNYV